MMVLFRATDKKREGFAYGYLISRYHVYLGPPHPNFLSEYSLLPPKNQDGKSHDNDDDDGSPQANLWHHGRFAFVLTGMKFKKNN